MDIHKYICLATVLLLTTAISAAAEPHDDGKPRLAYDVDFEMKFDNREFYRSRFSESMTIFGARLTPSIGLSIPQNSIGMNHRLMLGIDVRKDFGASPLNHPLPGTPESESDPKQNNARLFGEMTLYYNLNTDFESTGLELYAGVFPRKTMDGGYSEAFFSDSLKFYDNNIEGILLKIGRPKSYYEIGCDWFGQKGYTRKEKFMIFSSGRTAITPSLEFGYSGYMYHFAGSHKARGVVDNILLNPYLKLDLDRRTGFQEFSIRLGWLQALQHDRESVGHYVFPGGGIMDLTMKKWDVGIHNMFFYGNDMMPYYNSADTAGDKYGSRLYLGDPFYRIYDDYQSIYFGSYNRLDVFYEPHVGKYLTIRLVARFHFCEMTYSGAQQIVSILFNLNNK